MKTFVKQSELHLVAFRYIIPQSVYPTAVQFCRIHEVRQNSFQLTLRHLPSSCRLVMHYTPFLTTDMGWRASRELYKNDYEEMILVWSQRTLNMKTQKQKNDTDTCTCFCKSLNGVLKNKKFVSCVRGRKKL